MSDYTKTTNFTAKDSLASGDANKLILGADFDTEFDAIATAVATKPDEDPGSGEIVFNDSGADVNFRVESDTLENMLFVDAGTSRIGMGTGSPTSTLHMRGSNPGLTIEDSDVTGTLELNMVNAAAQLRLDDAAADASSVIQMFVDNVELFRLTGGTGTVVNETSVDLDFRVESTNNTHMLFVDAGNDAVGFNTSSINASALVEFTSTTKGVRIMNMTEAQRDAISTPAAGLLVYVTDGSNANKLHFYNGSAWGPV